jgi:hypothetical protein
MMLEPVCQRDSEASLSPEVPTWNLDSVPMAHGLLVWDSAGEAREYELRASRIGLGRGQRNQIRLQCQFLSTDHLELVRCEAGYEIHDLGSSNGTKVNGVLCRQHLLQDGDRLLIGARVVVHYFMLPEVTGGGARSLRERRMEIAMVRYLDLTRRIDLLERGRQPGAAPGLKGPADFASLEDLLRRVERLESAAAITRQDDRQEGSEGLES